MYCKQGREAAALIFGKLSSSKKSGKFLSELITSSQLSSITGKYIDRGKEVKSSKLSYNKDNARELWKTSIELVNLKKDETIFKDYCRSQVKITQLHYIFRDFTRNLAQAIHIRER